MKITTYIFHCIGYKTGFPSKTTLKSGSILHDTSRFLELFFKGNILLTAQLQMTD